MKLGLTYDTAFDFQRARQAYEEGFALWQRAGDSAAGRTCCHRPPTPSGWPGLEPSTLDPTLWISSKASGEQLFSGLVDHTPELGIVPDVAASWEVSGRRAPIRLPPAGRRGLERWGAGDGPRL